MTDTESNLNVTVTPFVTPPTNLKRKLLLIDSRILNINAIIDSINESTFCLVFNYEHDTQESILSKIRFLNDKNRYITDNFYYDNGDNSGDIVASDQVNEEQQEQQQFDESGNCITCKTVVLVDSATTNPANILLPSQIRDDLLFSRYTTENEEGVDVSLLSTVFFQRNTKTRVSYQKIVYDSQITPEDISAGAAIGTPVDYHFVEETIDRISKAKRVNVTHMDEIYEIGVLGGEIIEYELIHFETVGIMQHAYPTINTFNLFKRDFPAVLWDVVNMDPSIESWASFKSMVRALKTAYKMSTLDLMACALYANPNWKYIIDRIEADEEITIRASIDNTGSTEQRGNWIMETSNADLSTIYFTDKIYDWNYVLASNYQTFAYTGAYQTFTAPRTGTYTLEVWGAQGGNDRLGAQGGRGGYSKGDITLSSGTVVWVYVGGQGTDGGPNCSSSWESTGGGGGTDIRPASGDFASRYIVAGGGGGRHGKNYEGILGFLGNDGGGTTAPTFTASSVTVTGATQTGGGSSPYGSGAVGSFGYANPNQYTAVCSVGGWNGGARGSDSFANGGAGGGYWGGCTSWPTSSGGSGYVGSLANSTITAGNASMVDVNGNTMTGNLGNGVAKISWIGNTITYTGATIVNVASIQLAMAPYVSSTGGSSTFTYTVITDASACITNNTSGTLMLSGNIGSVTVRISEATSTDLNVVLTIIKTPVLNGFNAGVTSITKYYSDIGGTFTVTSPTSVTPSAGTPSYSYSIVYATNGPSATPITASIQSSSSASAIINVVATGQCYIRLTKAQDLANFLDTAFADVFLTVRGGYIIGPNVDLSGALIQNYDLSGTNLSGVNFTNASIINCILKNVNLTSTNFTNATFTYNTIDSSTNLENANFENLFSNNNVGTTTQISTTYAIRSGQIVKTGTILFAITFTMASSSSATLNGVAGYYEITANSLLINGRAETENVSTNIIVKAVNTEYMLIQSGITPMYKFTLFMSSANNIFHVQARDIVTNAIITLPYYAAIPQTFSVSFLVTTPISPYKILGSYIFGPNMSLAGVYFDNNINPKPDLTDLSFVNLTLDNNNTSKTVLQGWNFTRASLNSGNFSNILFQDCICNATDFSGSNLSNSSFTINYDSAISAVPNTATMVNTKFTNAIVTNLTITGYNNNTSVSANQMNVGGLDFSGCTIDGLKSYFLAGNPLRMKNAYGGPEYTMLTDTLIGRFIAGPTMNLSGLTLGNIPFNQTNFAGSNIYGTKLAATTMSGVRVSNGRLTYSSLTTTLPSNFKIVNPLLSANQQQQYTVTNSGTGAYVINAQNNPTIVLTRGARYVFNISASGHPFWIKTAPTTGAGDAYLTGVTNNGISSGTGITTFIVPNDAPNTLYYQCQYHASMGGTLTISDEINTYPTYIIGPGADLSGVDATGVVFTGANISGANFTNAIFTNVVSGQLTTIPIAPTLPSAYYSVIGGYFVGPYVDLSGSNFTGQSLANTNLTGANFTNSTLAGVTSGGISSTATISGVTATVAPTMASGYGLTGGYIIGPNMNFTGADLSGFDFTNVNLSGTNFTGANITYVKSGNTISSGSTILPDASHVFLNNFLLGPKVNLSSKDLSGIQLYNLTLSGSILVNTNLSYADISGTIIDGINFTSATFTRTRSRNIPQPTVAPTFTAGTAGGYVVRSGYLIGANVDLSSVDFTGFDLSNTVLTNVNLSNATFVNTRSGGITLNSLLPPSLPAKYKVVGGYLHGPRVDLSGANLTSYDFSTQANAINWSLANLTNATFTSMKSGWITIDSVGNDISGPILSFPYVYNRLVSANPSGGFIIGPNVSLNGATLTNYDLRNVVDITGVDFTNAVLTGVKTSGSITANAGNRPTFTSGSGYVLYTGRIFGPGVDVSGTDLSGLVFGTSAAAVAAGSTSALSATNFTNANLTRTSFYGSVVTGTLFTGSTFFRTRTGGLSYVTTAPVMPTPDYRYVTTDAVTGSGGYIIGPNVDLSGTNLRGAVFDNTNFKNVDMSGAVITNSLSNNVTFDASTNLPQGYKFITNSSRVSFIAGPNISLAGKSLDGAILANVDLTNTNLTNAGAIATTFNGTRSGGITFTSGTPPLFQSGSGYQIRGGYLIGPGVDLSNITVSTLAAANGVAYGAGLAGLDLSGANLVNAKFTGSDLSGVDLSGTALSFTDFSGANFINIKSGGKITFTTQPTLPSESYRIISNGYSESSSAFQRYIIGPGAKCRSADLSGAVFTRVDLSGIDFTGANFTRVSSGIMRNQPILSSLPIGFQLVVGVNTQALSSQDPSYNNATYFVGPTAILTSAFLKNASIVNCDITGANFTNADFTNLYSRGLTNSPSTPATMPNASYFVKGGYIFGPTVNLSGGDFTGLDLSGASLIRATMRNANFTNVNLTNANISNADLAGSTLNGATTVGVIYQGYNYGGDLSLQDPTFPAQYRYVYSSQAGYGCIIGPYVILTGADLRGSNLSYTNITGVNLVGANITIVRSVNIVIDNGIQPIFTPGSGFKVLSGYLIGPYADLTNIIFTDQDFSGTNLTGVNFTNSLLLNVKSGNIVAAPVMPIFPDTTFSLRGGYIIGPSVDLSNSDLSGVDLSNVTVTNANMSNSNFVNVKTGGVKGTTPLLKPTYMQRNGYIIGAGVDLSGADLSGQNLANAVFSDANVTNMVFTNTILTNVRSGGNMRYSALTTSRLPTKYTIRGTYIVGPNVDLSGGDLTGLDISNTFLSGANLSAVTFTGTRSGGIEMITTNPILFSDPAFYNGSEYGYKHLNGYIVGPKVNLSGADFSGVNISAVDVSGANMSNAVFTRIRSSNVVGVPSAITTGYKVTARHVVGPRLDMSGYDFTNGNFSGVDISGSNLTNAIFTNTSSGGVTGSPETLFTTTTLPVNVKYQLTQGYIVGPSVNLTGGDLSGVDVSGINLTGATLYDAITGKVIHNSETVLPSVDYTFIGDYIVGPNVNLSLVDFSGADLRYTNLTNVNFGSANLTNVRSGYIIGTPRQLPPLFSFISGFIVGPSTDLSGADLSGGNLSGCNIQGADLTNANFYNVRSGGVTGTPRVPLTTPYTITSNGYVVGPNVNLGSANLASINLQGLNLTNAIMTGATFTNAKFGNNIGPPRSLTSPFIYVQTVLSGGYVVGPYIDLSRANFSYASIAQADLTGANLGTAVFYRTRSGNMNAAGAPSSLTANYSILPTTVSGGYLIGPNVDLNDANFSGSGTVLTGRNISGALMERVVFNGTRVGGGGLIGPPSALSSDFRYIESSVSGGYIIGPNIDLSGANFKNTDISFVRVDGVNFTNANFTNTITGRLISSSASPSPTVLTSPYRLINSTLSGGYIIGPNVNMTGANLAFTDISNTVLTGVNLTNASFTRTKTGLLTATTGALPTLSPSYRYVNTTSSGGYIVGPTMDLTRANLAGSDLSRVSIYGCDISQAILPSTLTYIRSGGLVNANPPAVLPSPYLFITNEASGAYIVGPYADLSGANLESSIITGSDISSADFTNARLKYVRSGGMVNAHPPAVLPSPYLFIPNDASGAYIVGPYADLSGANLERSVITGADISGANFTYARLKYIRSGGMVNAHPPAVLPSPYLFITNEASGAYIVGPYADLSGANLESSIITGADISSADFTRARLKYVRSGGMVNNHPPAVLPSTYLFITNDASGAYIVGPYADLSGANLESSIITGADISSADFTRARLKYVRSGGMVNSHPPAVLPSPYLFITNDVSGAYIVGPYADLSGANLESSIITGADISSADFTRARLKYVRSGGMVNSHPPAVLPNPYLFITNDASGAYIVGPYSDLSGANLESSIITGADISSADFTRARLRRVRSGGMVNSHPPAVLPSPYLFIPNDASGAYIVGPYADLSGANLEASIITGADISSADFTRARLRDLKSGNLSAAGRPAVLPTTYTFNVSATAGYGGYIIGTGVNISSAVLDGTDLSGVVFTDANMHGASLSGGGTSLVNVRSGGIRGIPASLPPGYTFVNDNSSGGYIVGRRVDLSGSNLTNCVISGLDVSGANLTGAIMVNTKTGPNLIGPPAYFPSPAYSYIVSSASGGFIIGPNANIVGANLVGADLSGFNFKGMNITGVDFSGTNLTNVKSGGTVGPPTRLPSPYVFMTDNSFGAYIVGPRVDLSGVNLTNCRFTGLNISGTSFTNAVLINVKSGGGMIGPPGSLPPKYRFVVDNSLGGGGDGTGGYFIGPGVDLSGASLRNQTDSEVNLSGAYFTDANITNARFSGSAMPRVKSGGMVGPPASLPNTFTFVVSASGGYFIGPYVDLTNANLNSTVLTGMNITHADLTGATFVNTLTGALAGPPDAITTGYHYVVRNPAPALDAYIIGPRVNLTSAVLHGTNLTNFDMSGVNLTNAVFTGTNFTNTNIFGSNLTGAAAFTNTQRMQLLKNSNNRGITKAQVTQCLGGEIDIIAATSTTPNTHTYNPIYDYIREMMVDVLTSDTSGNSNLSRYTGRAFYIPSSPGESFYVDASATGPLVVTPTPSNSPRYYYDQGRYAIIETATENTIRTISVGGRIFLVFGGSMLGLVMDDVYSAMGFPSIYKTYSYYGVRNMILPPQIPVVHTILGNGQFSLNWEPSFYDGKPRLGYVIEYTTHRPVANVYGKWITYSEQYALTNVTIFGLTNGTRYYIRVAAINPVGRGPYSPVAEIMPGTTPNAITTLFVNGGNNALTLEWVTPYDQGYVIRNYIIKYKVISGNPTEDDANAFTVITVSASGLTVDATKRTSAYTLTQAANGIANGITYDVRIAAVNDIGSGEFGAMIAPNSTFAVAGIRPDIILATTINSSLVVENMGGKIRLSWLPPVIQGDLTVYAYSIQSVEVAVGAGIAPPPIADASWNIVPVQTYSVLPDNVRGNGSVYAVISGLANGKSYTFRIAAISGVGRGPYSQPIPAVVPGSVPTPPVSAQMGVTVDTVEGAKLTLFWNAVKTNGYAITAYRARIRTDALPITWSESPIISVPSGIVNTLSYRNQVFLGLTNGRAYYMGVAAQNALGWSEYSETIAETPRTVPQPPPSITSAPLNEALRVQWAGNGASDGGYPVIGYRLQYKPNIVSSTGWVDIDLSGIYITNRDIMNLNNGITYNLRVLRRNAIGFSSPSSEISGIPGTVSGPPTNMFLSPGPQRIDAYWQPPIDVGTNDVEYYYVQYKLTSAADSEYAYLNNVAGTTPKQITEFSAVPNAPGYDGYVANINNLTNGLSYSIRIVAVTRVGLGAWCAPSTSIPGTVPSQIE